MSLGALSPLKNSGSHIDASLARQPLVKGERLVRCEVNAVMLESQGRARRGAAEECGAMFVRSARAVCPRARQALKHLVEVAGAWGRPQANPLAYPCGSGNDTTSDA